MREIRYWIVVVVMVMAAVVQAQVPPPCGSSIHHPCWSRTVPTDYEMSPGQREAFRRTELAEIQQRAARYPVEVQFSDGERIAIPASCATCEKAVIECGKQLKEYRNESLFVGILGSVFGFTWLLIGVSTVLIRLDKIVAAFRRSELPAQMFWRGAFYMLAAFGGTLLALGLQGLFR